MLQSIKSLIDNTAKQYGVAPWIAEDIAQLESSGNPKAVGDHGTSFGLYQLHWGGQGTGYSAAQLEDPVLNAQIGISHLAGAYRSGVNKGLSGWALEDYTATHSGHPGSAGVGAYPSYESALHNVFNQSHEGSSLPILTDTSAQTNGGQPTTKAPDTFAKGDNLIDVINNSMKMKNFNVFHPAQSITQDAGAIALRLVITLVGLLLIIFGLYATVIK